MIPCDVTGELVLSGTVGIEPDINAARGMITGFDKRFIDSLLIEPFKCFGSELVIADLG